MTTSKAKTPLESIQPHTADGVAIRPALEILSHLRHGQVMDLLSIEINRVVNGVKDCESGKGGTVTMTLKIDRLKNFPDAVQLRIDIDGKAPQDPPGPDMMFFDDDGNLFARSQRQRDIFEDGPKGV